MLEGKPDLVEVIGGLPPSGGLPRGLDGGKPQPNQDTDDGDGDQESR
jgi:hypothetical protein